MEDEKLDDEEETDEIEEVPEVIKVCILFLKDLKKMLLKIMTNHCAKSELCKKIEQILPSLDFSEEQFLLLSSWTS